MTYQFCCVSIWYGGGLGFIIIIEIYMFIIFVIITILDYNIELK